MPPLTFSLVAQESHAVNAFRYERRKATEMRWEVTLFPIPILKKKGANDAILLILVFR